MLTRENCDRMYTFCCVADILIVCSDIVILSRQARTPVCVELEVGRVSDKGRTHLQL